MLYFLGRYRWPGAWPRQNLIGWALVGSLYFNEIQTGASTHFRHWGSFPFPSFPFPLPRSGALSLIFIYLRYFQVLRKHNNEEQYK